MSRKDKVLLNKHCANWLPLAFFVKGGDLSKKIQVSRLTLSMFHKCGFKTVNSSCELRFPLIITDETEKNRWNCK